MIEKEKVLNILRELRGENIFNSFAYRVLTKAIERIEELKDGD